MASIRVISGGRAIGSARGRLDAARADLAARVARLAGRVRASDVDAPRRHGLVAPGILDVAPAAAAGARSTQAPDGTGVEPDAAHLNLEAHLRDAPATGRPIAAAGSQ